MIMSRNLRRRSSWDAAPGKKRADPSKRIERSAGDGELDARDKCRLRRSSRGAAVLHNMLVR